MNTSRSHIKKRPHRSHNRTPKLYRWADVGTEGLIYITVLWGPWAFGTVHDWAIFTMNIANYGIGLLLLLKWGIRYTTGYYPSRWMAQKNDQNTTHLPKRNWCTKAAAAFTIYLLGYILISVLNVRANFNHDFNFFEYEEKFIKWLPHTYDKPATIQSLLAFLGLACCFWGVRDWLLFKPIKERREENEALNKELYFNSEERSFDTIPVRLKRLFWLLAISGGLLALVGIIQRLDGTPKLLWLYERERFGTSVQSFGPFGYRANGISYLNMIFPITIGFLIWGIQRVRTKRIETGMRGSEAHFILYPLICMMFIAPFIALSRGGILVMGGILFLGFCISCFRPNVLSLRERIGAFVFILSGSAIAFFIGGESLMNRLNSKDTWHETRIAMPSYTEKIHYSCHIPNPPYENHYRLLLITDSRSEKFRNVLYDLTLYKNGNVRVLIEDYLTKGQRWIMYTNAPQLESGRLDLEVSRTSSGLETKANGKLLSGKEYSIGDVPPSWSHPIVLNEVLFYIQKNETDLVNRTLTIHPNHSKDVAGIQNTKRFEMNLNKVWDFENILSKLSSRDRIYDDAWTMLKDHKWLGCGAGAWSTVYFLYRDPDEVWDAWVHCDVLEYLITFGVFGFIPGSALIGITFFKRNAPVGFHLPFWIQVGLNLAIIGCILHSLIDFPLQVESIMHFFVIVCAIKLIALNKPTSK